MSMCNARFRDVNKATECKAKAKARTVNPKAY